MNFFGVLLILLLIAFCVFEVYSLVMSIINKRRKKKLEFESSTKNSQENEGKE